VTGLSAAASSHREGALLWCARSVVLGAALGALLASLGQATVVLFGGAPLAGLPPSLPARIGGVLLNTAGYAAILLAASAMTAPAVRWALGRAVAVTLTTLLVTALAAAHAIGVEARVLSGAYVTRGALEFARNGEESLLRALQTTYASEVAIAALVGLTAALGGGVYLRRALRLGGDARRAARILKTSALLLALAFAALGVSPLRAAMPQGFSRTTPELALLSSLRTTPWASTASTLPDVPEGPPRLRAVSWARDLQQTHPPRPNVLLLVIDSISTRHVGYLGYDRPVTPNIDRIAAGSMRLLRTWTTATHSNYAQPAILSSLFPRRVAWLDQYTRLDYPRVLLHDVFHLAGHTTATISSQDENWQGMLRFEQTGTPTSLWHAPDHSGTRVDIISEKVVPDEVTAERAVAWMDAHRGRPWSLYVNFQIAHFPYGLPPGAAQPFVPAHLPPTVNYLRYGEAERPTMINRYDDAIAYVDAQVGKIADYLARSGQLDDTLWVITADHGEMMGEHGIVTHGKSLYEGEARVPLLFHYPRRVAPADVLAPVSLLDVLPTITDLAGLPTHPAFQGQSFADPAAHAAARRGIFLNTQGFRMTEGIVCFPWKLWIDRTSGQEEHLHQLEDDPDEAHDLHAERPEITRALSSVLAAQMQAQLEYHREGNQGVRDAQFAPRMLSCPALPDR
jgi:arylsulfatase A-like enzyme